MKFQVLKTTALQGVKPSVEAHLYQAGEVLADDEVEPFVRERVLAGDPHYTALLQPLTDDEEYAHRVKQTAVENLERMRNDRGRQSAEDLATTPAVSLRWADTNPGNAAHIRELETRLSSVERRLDALDEKRETPLTRID